MNRIINITNLVRIPFIIGLMLILVSPELKAENDSIPKVSLSIDTAQMLIGDHKKVNLRFESNKNIMVQWPDINKWTNKIVVVDPSLPDTIESDSKNIYEHNFKITCFDTGFIALPPIKFVYTNGKTIDTVETKAKLLQVNGIKVDHSKNAKPIKDIKKEPYTLKEFLPYILIALAAIILILIAIYVIIKLKRKEPIIPKRVKPLDPPHIEAMKLLKNLENKKLWQSGKIKEYYTDLTNILRHYISRTYHLHAMEKTSSEILNDLDKLNIEKSLISKVKDLLETSDFVKFAKQTPPTEKYSLHLKTVSKFVEETKPNEETETPKTDKE